MCKHSAIASRASTVVRLGFAHGERFAILVGGDWRSGDEDAASHSRRRRAEAGI